MHQHLNLAVFVTESPVKPQQPVTEEPKETFE
jgi:hypothetical protein